jgi:hypothetical protein
MTLWGGHGAVAAEFLEDEALARKVKEWSAHRLRRRRGPGLRADVATLAAFFLLESAVRDWLGLGAGPPVYLTHGYRGIRDGPGHSALHLLGCPSLRPSGLDEAQNRTHCGRLATIHGHTYVLEVTLGGRSTRGRAWSRISLK